jgi:hypothetical protein
MRKFLLLSAAALSFLGFASQANAALTVSVSSGKNFDNFDTDLGLSNFTDANGVMWSGTGKVVQGSVTNQYLAPAGDASPYMVVMRTQSETATWSMPVTSLLIYWGSVDGDVCPSASCNNDNQIMFSDGSQVTGQLLLTAGISPATGDKLAPNTNLWILVSGITFDTATFTSTGNSFEFDQEHVKFIPEPSTWVMVMAGFAGLGYAAFRRKGKARLALT